MVLTDLTPAVVEISLIWMPTCAVQAMGCLTHLDTLYRRHMLEAETLLSSFESLGQERVSVQ